MERLRRLARGLLDRVWPERVLRDPRRDRAALGRAGERLVARRLARAGARPLARGLRTPRAELDLVVLEARTVLVVVEVKTRRTTRELPLEQLRFRPRDGFSAAQRRRLEFAAADLARSWGYRRARLDLVEVLVRPPGSRIEVARHRGTERNLERSTGMNVDPRSKSGIGLGSPARRTR